MSNDPSLLIPDRLHIRLADGQIKEMQLDEYLQGVVPTEMGLQKPFEALKAQAITARSYAVVTRRHAQDGFDLCVDTHCQVWKPENRYPDSDRAIAETSGLVVVYRGRVVATHFFAHCDGRTRNSEEAWSGRVAYLRSVPCICGYTALYGHGVGMCQRGAAAMAEQGATAGEIIKHYYTGVEIARATLVPRAELRQSVILGRVVDGQGQPRKGLQLSLKGPEGPINRGTTGDGRFWFSKLPAGYWELKVKGKPVRYTELPTDGRSAMDLQVVVPDAPPLVARTVPLAHPQQLIGTLGYNGVPVTLTDPAGNEQTVLSGSAADFGPGGFVLPLSGKGTYRVRFLDRNFDLEVAGKGLWVRFVAEDF